VTLPGNRVPEGEPQPVYDREGVRWSWEPERQLFICDDPNYDGPPVTEPGAIPPERQPTFAHPPTLRQQIAMEMHPDER
jgi:hypothetical protein